MALEIERKYMLANDAWKCAVIKSEHMRDGLIARLGDGKVRVRLTGSGAWLTIKGPRKDTSRLEFEYEIPRADAEQILRTLCQRDPVIEKVRYTVPFGGLDWTIDVYLGRLAGVVFAEVELERPDQHLELPPWVGQEVTNDPRFRMAAVVRRLRVNCHASMKPDVPAESSSSMEEERRLATEAIEWLRSKRGEKPAPDTEVSEPAKRKRRARS